MAVIRHVLLAILLAFCFAAPASATTCGGFTVPTDIAAQPGWTCNTVTPTYDTTNSAHNVITDPAVTPPSQAGFTNIASPSYTGRVYAHTGDSSTYVTLVADGGSGSQCKFRTHVDFAFYAPDDPIRNFGAPGTSHLHQFFGNGTTNASSTYKSLRNRALTSTAAGTDANGTGYWSPAIIVRNRDGDSKNYVVKMDYAIVYYEKDCSTLAFENEAKKQTALVPGLRYVFGYNMGDGSAWLQAILTAANTANQAAGGAANRYTLSNVTHQDFNSQAYYACAGATTDASVALGPPGGSKYLKKADGTDPWNGTCASGAEFFVDIGGPDCWDGVNLWSPGGYKHLIPKVWDSKYGEYVCPQGWYMVPSLLIEFHYTQYGPSDYLRWELASDAAERTARGGTTATMPDGFSFHTDWMHGWDQVVMLKWQTNCLGVNHTQPHQCAVSQISGTEALTPVGSPGAGGRNPQVDLSSVPHALNADSGWGLIPNAWSNSITTMHVHH